jgi:hypothetical protein
MRCPAVPSEIDINHSEAYFTGACPVKFTIVRSEAYFTGVAPRKKPGRGRQMVLGSNIKKAGLPLSRQPGCPTTKRDPWLSVSRSLGVWLYQDDFAPNRTRTFC